MDTLSPGSLSLCICISAIHLVRHRFLMTILTRLTMIHNFVLPGPCLRTLSLTGVFPFPRYHAQSPIAWLLSPCLLLGSTPSSQNSGIITGEGVVPLYLYLIAVSMDQGHWSGQLYIFFQLLVYFINLSQYNNFFRQYFSFVLGTRYQLQFVCWTATIASAQNGRLVYKKDPYSDVQALVLF